MAHRGFAGCKRVWSLLLLGCTFLLLPAPLFARKAVSFNLSTTRSYSPGEKPQIHLYAHNVDVLEFRIYRVEDPERFMMGLPELHSFGNQLPGGPKEQIDEPTLLERWHDWKHHIWFLVRRFFRDQFSAEARDTLREKQAGMARKSRIVGAAQFAAIPLLNDKRLVARWRQEMPPTFISDSQELPIDPLPAGFYLIEATDGHFKAYTVLMVSQLALIDRTTEGSVLAFTVDRRTGQPIAGAQVSLFFGKDRKGSGVTAADGTFQFPAQHSDATPDNVWALARSGDNIGVVTPWGYSFTSMGSQRWAAYVYTDRPVYRPGHTVHWKAILREHARNGLELPKPAPIHTVISDEQDHSLLDKDLPISADGTVAGDLQLPANAALGYYTLRLGDAEQAVVGSFHVEDYKKPEYQVRVTPTKLQLLQGDAASVVIDARYFFGEPVANAKVKYRVYTTPHYWWDESQDETVPGEQQDASGDNQEGYDYNGAQALEQEGRLDGNGKLTVSIPTRFDAQNHRDRNHRDLDYTIEAGVTDEARREITGRGRFIATVGSFRVHVEPATYVAQQGQPAKFAVTAVDYDNKPVQTAVHLRLLERKWSNGSSTTTERGSTDVTTDSSGRATAQIKADGAGSMEVEASAKTPENRTVQDTSWLWVIGAKNANADYGFLSGQNVQIVADKKVYAPGDTAHLTLVSEEGDIHALVTVSGMTLQTKEVVSSPGKTMNFDIPIGADAQPNLNVDAVYMKNDQLYQAHRSLKVPPAERTLNVEITPDKGVFQPGESASFEVTTKDHAGKPVSADMSFGVVDEAIYSIQRDTSGDMVSRLYPDRSPSVSVESSLTYYFSGEAGLKSPMLAMRESRYRRQLAQVKPGSDLVQPKIRKAFPDTAFWASTIHTNAGGHARVTLVFPDSLTTWRTTVHTITADSKAGSAINRVLVRKNIIVRMGTPRFLSKGDMLTVPLIVHNYLDQPKQATVSLDVQGLTLLSGAAQQLSVPSRGEATLPWGMRADAVGTATLLGKALTNQESDALQVSFPVEPIGVPETINGGGIVSEADGRAELPVNFPANTDPAAHSVAIQVSPSIAGSLFSALDYLTSFPYGCTEQTMSSLLPNVIVSQTLAKLKVAAHVDQESLGRKINAGLQRLYDYQHDDGGWGWWKEDDSRVYMTAYVVSGLAQVKSSGTAVDTSHLTRGIDYLGKQLTAHPRMKPELRAYVAYALAQAGRPNSKSLDVLWSRRNDLSSEALALTGLILAQSQDSRAQDAAHLLESKAQQKGAVAYWEAAHDELLDIDEDDSVEATAYALKLLVHADPKSPLLPKAAQWLVLARNGGGWWFSTKQTATAIYGLADYLVESKELQGDFDVDVLLNGASVAKRHFTSADAVSGAVLPVQLPASPLRPQGNMITIVKHGSGSAYWSVRGTYYATEKRLYQKGSLSLNLTRDYYKLVKVEKNGEIQYRLDPLNGTVASGDVLAVHLAVNGSPAKYLVIEDPIPAGTEFELHEGSYTIQGRPDTWEDWFIHREFRDDRAAFFVNEFSGRHESFYLLKVVNPGSFAISPAHVEPMYQPEVQATTDALRLEVKP